MMNRCNNILQIALSAIFLLAGCEKADTAADSDARHTTLRVTIVPMTIVGEQVPYDTRASKPLNPEDENVIYSLAVLVFDESEGVLHKFDKSGKYYKYIALKDENGNGLLSTKLPIEDFPVQPDETYTICLVANLSEEQVEKIINDMMADGTAFIHEFEEVSVMIPYVTPDKADGQLETGHVREIYMFGYYEGVLPGTESGLSIYLGRIIARIEVNFTIDDPEDLKKKFYIGLANMETKAYVFPGAQSPNAEDAWLDMKPTERSEEIRTGACQFYFYAAPHSTDVSDKATRLQIWYVDEGTVPSDDNVSATVLLCNNPDTKPEDAMEGDYYLNRNSIYHVNIHLSEKRDGTPVVRSGCRRR